LARSSTAPQLSGLKGCNSITYYGRRGARPAGTKVIGKPTELRACAAPTECFLQNQVNGEGSINLSGPLVDAAVEVVELGKAVFLEPKLQAQPACHRQRTGPTQAISGCRPCARIPRGADGWPFLRP